MRNEKMTPEEFHEGLLKTVDDMVESMQDDGEPQAWVAPTYVLFSPCRDDVGKDTVTQVSISPDVDIHDPDTSEAVQQLIDEAQASRVALISIGSRMLSDTMEEAVAISNSPQYDDVLDNFGDPYIGVTTVTKKRMLTSLRIYEDEGDERHYKDWEHSGWIELDDLEYPAKSFIGFEFDLHSEGEA